MRIAVLSFSPSRASVRCSSAERATRESRRVLQPLARIRETRKRRAGNARFAALSFSTSRGFARRASAERATCESRRFHSAPRAHPGDAPARSRQRAIRGGFLQPLAHPRDAPWSGKTRGATPLSTPRALPRDAPARSGQHAILGGFPSAPRARLRNAKARSGKRAIRGDFIQHLARIRETRQRGVGNARFAALSFSSSRASVRCAIPRSISPTPSRSALRAHPGDEPARSRQRAIRGGFLQPLARVRETRKRGAGNARFAALSFCPSRASVRRESV